jgi:plasmid stabilization system protein ParE
LAEIVGYIAEDDPEAATRFGNALLDHLELLPRFPRMSGMIRQRSKVRRLVHSPILVYYTVRESDRRIEILHFRHAARKPARF